MMQIAKPKNMQKTLLTADGLINEKNCDAKKKKKTTETQAVKIGSEKYFLIADVKLSI